MVRVLFHLVAALALIATRVAGDDACKVVERAYGTSDESKTFSDFEKVAPDSTIVSVHVRGDKCINSICIRSKSGDTVLELCHGKEVGKLSQHYLKDGEFIESVRVCWPKSKKNTALQFVEFKTNLNTIVNGGIDKDTDTHVFKTSADYKLGGIHGIITDHIETLGVILLRKNCIPFQNPDGPGSHALNTKFINPVSTFNAIEKIPGLEKPNGAPILYGPPALVSPTGLYDPPAPGPPLLYSSPTLGPYDPPTPSPTPSPYDPLAPGPTPVPTPGPYGSPPPGSYGSPPPGPYGSPPPGPPPGPYGSPPPGPYGSPPPGPPPGPYGSPAPPPDPFGPVSYLTDPIRLPAPGPPSRSPNYDFEAVYT